MLILLAEFCQKEKLKTKKIKGNVFGGFQWQEVK
jgi:hypothetical protein